MQFIGYLKSNLVPGNNLKQLEYNSKILVNSNRLYWQLSELSRKKEKNQTIRIILEEIQNINDDQKLYVEMRVKDAIECFGDNLAKVPANTFINIPTMSSVAVSRK
ncbi:hypothetical protein B5E53_18260 [Eubacterium sp. An11]|uniref:hypothetical protein n=1 Tax=Eubacterium sp. An11 TaxID=1965542 RepID=UPI000B3AA577|nr:hypothetical protein [Eubacterium sp. An11]OUQ62102.1 hypothetical protein B5E53_18260 [Eubacterium sp. An11]